MQNLPSSIFVFSYVCLKPKELSFTSNQTSVPISKKTKESKHLQTRICGTPFAWAPSSVLQQLVSAPQSKKIGESSVASQQGRSLAAQRGKDRQSRHGWPITGL